MSVALAITVMVLASAVGGAVGQSAPINVTNTTNGSTNGTNSTRVVNVTDGANGTNVSGGPDGGGGGFGFGVPSTDEIVGDAVNGTVDSITGMFARALGGVLMLPWQLVALRGAPFTAASEAVSGPGGLFARPDVPVYGTLYDMAMGSLFRLAALLFALMFVLDWFGNFSMRSSLTAMDRLFLRGADMLHLLFSWPIAWGHFIIASAISLWLLPDAETVGGSFETATSSILGISLVGVALVFSVVALLIAVYLIVKHFGAFVYLIVGLGAYPLLVAMSIPDHWLLGSLGEHGERARKRYPVAAWYPVPTVVVLFVGYGIADRVVDLVDLMQSQLPATTPLADPSIGFLALYFPVLWLVALYAPDKVFGDGGLAEQAKRAAPGAIAGGAAGAATGSTAGASAGAASGSAAGASSASALAAGTASDGALASGTSSAAGRLTAGTGANGGSAGATILAGDGGTRTVAQSAGSDWPSGSTATGSTTSTRTGTVDAITPSSGEVDLSQRYEPVQQRKDGFDTVERPRSAKWLVSNGGAEQLNQRRIAADDPVYFRGETDGELYDLRGAASEGDVLAVRWFSCHSATIVVW